MAVLAQDLRNSILQAAMQGKLTEQLEGDSKVDDLIANCKIDKQNAINEGKYRNEKYRGAIPKDEHPYTIPENWKYVHISDMSLFQEGPGILAVDFRNSGVPLIRISGMKTNIVSLDGCNYLDEEMVKSKWEHFKLDIGDIVISSSASLDKIAEVDEKTEGAIVYTGLIRFKMYGGINKKYFKYFIQSPLYIQQINEQKKGGTIKHYGPTHLKKMIIPLPPIEEQQRIVEKLEEILPQIDEYEKTEMKLEALKKKFPEEMKKSLFQSACQGTLTKQLETDSSVVTLFEELNITEYDGANPYEIPETWKFAELEDLVSYTIKRGKSPKYVDKSNIYVFAQKCNLKYGTLSLAEAKYLDEKTLSKYSDEDYLQDKDIVINSTGGGTMGRVKMFESSIVPNGMKIVPDSHVTTVRIKEGLNKDYIYYIIKYMQPYLESKGVGSTNQKELKPDVIKGLIIPIPPIEEQQRIVEKLDGILPHCDTLV